MIQKSGVTTSKSLPPGLSREADSLDGAASVARHHGHSDVTAVPNFLNRKLSHCLLSDHHVLRRNPIMNAVLRCSESVR